MSITSKEKKNILRLPGIQPQIPFVFNPRNIAHFNPYFLYYKTRNLKNSTGPSSTTGTTDGVQVIGRGEAGAFSAVGYDSYDNLPALTGQEFCMVFQFYVTSKTNNDILFQHSSGATNITKGVVLWPDNTGFFTGNSNCFSINIDAARVETSQNSCVEGKMTNIVVNWNKSSDVEVWIDGNLDTTGFASGTPGFFDTVGTTVNIGGAGTLDDFNGGIHFLAAQNRHIPSPAARMLSIDPYLLTLPITSTRIAATGAPPVGLPIPVAMYDYRRRRI